MRVALVFPGQGTQYRGMGRELVLGFPAAAQMRNEIAAALRKIDRTRCPAALMAGGTSEIMHQSDLCQLLIFMHSAMAWAVFESQLVSASSKYITVAGLGHSCGELTAHFAAGTFSLADTVSLVLERGHLMREAPDGALLNVEGLDRCQINDVLLQFSNTRPPEASVFLAIQQGPRLHAVGGLPRNVADFEALLRGRGVSCRPVMGVHKAVHTPLQSPIRERFQAFLDLVPVSTPRYPVLSTVRGDFHGPGQARADLAAQLDSESRFCDALKRIAPLKPDLYLVFGPGAKIAELLAHYNGIDADRIRVIERSSQVRDLSAELFGAARTVRRQQALVQQRREGRAWLRARLRGFERGQEEYVLIEPDGRIAPLADALDRSGTLILFKGSFNPIHNGHVALFEAVRRRHPDAYAAFALSVCTRKDTLSRRELLFRARMISAAGYPVVISYSGYFYRNVAWLRERAAGPRLVFLMGVDVLRRLLESFSAREFSTQFAGVVFQCAGRGDHEELFSRSIPYPANVSIRHVNLGKDLESLSSSEIRALADRGREDEVLSRMPKEAALLFLRSQRFLTKSLYHFRDSQPVIAD